MPQDRILAAAPEEAPRPGALRLPSRSAWIGAASILLFVLLWQGVSASGLVSSLVLPGPLDLVGRAVELAGPGSNPPYQLELDVASTLARLLGGFAVAALVAVPLGVAAALSRPVARIVMPFVTVLLAIPALALVPILMLLTGIGEATDFTVVVVTASVPILVYVHDGVRTIDRKYFWTARSFAATRLAVFRHVVLPAIAVPLLSGFRTGMGYAWRSLIATESLTALTGGLGYTIFQASQFFDTKAIYFYMVVIALLGFAIESAFRLAETRTAVRWGVLSAGSAE